MIAELGIVLDVRSTSTVNEPEFKLFLSQSISLGRCGFEAHIESLHKNLKNDHLGCAFKGNSFGAVCF